MSLPAGLAAPVTTLVTVANPSAGADWSYTMPANTWGRLLTGTQLFTTTNTATFRYPAIYINDGSGNQISRLEFFVSGGNPRNASSTVSHFYSAHNWQMNGGTNIVGVTMDFNIPRIIFQPGWVLGFNTPQIQAGDTWTSIIIQWALWSAPPYIDAFGPPWRPR